MIRKLKKSICILTLAYMCLASFVYENVNADFADSLPIPELTGDYRQDLLAVAESQIGYCESDTGETIYSDWAGQSGRSWCSEFVAWCADQAGIPVTLIPVGTSSNKYRKFFSEQGQFFILDNGKDNDSCGCAALASKTISFSEILPGDILLVDTDKDYADGPDHTCIAVSISDSSTVLTIDGNSRDQVEYRTRKAKKIHGVCRPFYNLTAVSASVIRTGGATAQISWDPLTDVSGYQIFRSKKKNGNYQLIQTVSAQATSCLDVSLAENKNYYYKVRAYLNYNETTVYGAFSSKLSAARLEE